MPLSPPRAATVTVAPARRSTSIGVVASISSNSSASTTSTFGIRTIQGLRALNANFLMGPMESLAGKRLVIFGCGYVGTAVAGAAIARGMRVTALTRNAAKAVGLRTRGIETVIADLATSAWHEQIAGGADCVLNCVSSGGGGLEGYRRSYVDGMASILAWARRGGPAQTIVYTSST